MAASLPGSPLNVGFLTIFQEASGYLGGYLVINQWGRPLEFRLSTAVQPNRVQQILYGDTLEPYLCADLIGRALVEKGTVPVQLVVTDREPVLDLRLRQAVPVVWLAQTDCIPAATAALVRPAEHGRGPLLAHSRFPEDVTVVQELLARLDAITDLAEPFSRIRDAIGEARKLGVSGRAA